MPTKAEVQLGCASGERIHVAYVRGLDTNDAAAIAANVEAPPLTNDKALMVSTYPTRPDLAGRVMVTVPVSVLLPSPVATMAEVDLASLCDALYALAPETYKRVLCDNMLAADSALTPADNPRRD